MTHAPKPERVGVFGGTFDPVHVGHLHIADGLREALGLDRVIWVPAGRPPHKLGQIVSSDEDRLAMLTLALLGSSHDRICKIEIARAGPSYTADTLESLHVRVEPNRLYFLMGEDSLRDFPTWRDPERILRAADLAVAGRPGVDANLDILFRQVPELRNRVTVAPLAELPISSSLIRGLVAQGKPIAGLVPDSVAAYIAEHGLYLPAAPLVRSV